MSGLHFLDTGYLLALELANDQNHRAAAGHWQQFLLQQPRLVTTSFVFDETVTFFNAHGHHAKAVEVGSNLLDSPSIQLIHVEQRLFEAGWNLLKRHLDKRYSMTDCISFVVMRELSISRALTFDRHFVQAGFEVLPVPQTCRIRGHENPVARIRRQTAVPSNVAWKTVVCASEHSI